MTWVIVQQQGILLRIRRYVVLTRTVTHRQKWEYQAVMATSRKDPQKLKIQRAGENINYADTSFATPPLTVFAQ